MQGAKIGRHSSCLTVLVMSINFQARMYSKHKEIYKELAKVELWKNSDGPYVPKQRNPQMVSLHKSQIPSEPNAVGVYLEEPDTKLICDPDP